MFKEKAALNFPPNMAHQPVASNYYWISGDFRDTLLTR